MFAQANQPDLSLEAAARFQENAKQFYTFGVKGPSATAKWSSLIGIITAIIGNVLISIALNTQRYAHVQLEKEKLVNERAYYDRNNLGDTENYGTIQSKIADDRAKQNVFSNSELGKSARTSNGSLTNGSHETSALIPSISSQDSEDDSNKDSEDDNPDFERKSYLKSPFWWLGIILMIIGEAGNFLAYGFAPASIVSPLGVVAIISNCLIAPILLKEPFRYRDLLGVVIAVAGAVTIILSAKTSNPKLGPKEIWTLISRWEFETYLGITLCAIVCLMIASNKYGHRTIVIDLGLVGLFGGYTALSTKGVASLLSYELWKAPTHPITYLLVAVLVGTAVMQIKYINRALQRFDSTQVIPTQFVCFTIFVIVGSAVLYRDFVETTVAQATKFVGGCALTFFGVWCITSGRSTDEEDYEISLDEEDAIDLVEEDVEEQAAALDSPPSQPSTPKQKSKIPLAIGSIINGNTSPASFDIDSPSSFATAPQTPRHPLTLQATASSPHLRSPNKNRSSVLIPQNRPPPSPVQSTPRIGGRNRPHTSHQNYSDGMLSPTTHTLLRTPKTPNNPDGTFPLTRSTSTNLRAVPRTKFTAGLRPGPLTAPLSSSLSGVVAYTLKRGVAGSPSSFSSADSFIASPGGRRKSSGARGPKRRSMLVIETPSNTASGTENEEAVEEGADDMRDNSSADAVAAISGRT